MTPKASCSLIEHWIYLALDGELSEELERQLEAHLDGCHTCRERHARIFREEQLLAGELDSIGGALDALLEGRINSTSIERHEQLQALADSAHERERQRGNPGTWALAASFLILVGAAALLWLFLGDDTPPTPAASSTVGTLTWQGDGIWVTGARGQKRRLVGSDTRAARPQETIHVPVGTELVMRLPDGSRVEVAEGSRFRVDEREGRLHLHLDSGSAVFEVQPQQVGLLITTPLAEVEVVGTVFAVSHGYFRGGARVLDFSKNDRRVRGPLTWVEVAQGMVRVNKHGSLKSWSLAAEESIQIREKAQKLKRKHRTAAANRGGTQPRSGSSQAGAKPTPGTPTPAPAAGQKPTGPLDLPAGTPKGDEGDEDGEGKNKKH